ncbi:uncharacterized protein PGTG_10352 [Puccinia graminis f. sp. tritici CRL 75-36-700-3]|uniref:Roadblock/LAMTOR2 domain-containing protein n=1 Tax=Puccinia graminis f. sp. tritici (strain CRL 75-36-700-3 / race SCCL) TaxID=418459 RepID=E3KKQ6_PUCGT|nr:uncharacterized protein PGTG_10352 [Puccinia graminis f. sp. tritici CRL 75-36-700-3]EFP84881.2 hypothetical protein PGTG_10352 [Puccinia graminis f. sp. tritici CRL 75-36-700-3]
MAVQTTPPSSSMSTAKPGTTEGAGPSQPTPSTTMPTTTRIMAGPPEVESTIQRLSEHRNVRGVIILNRDDVVIRSSGPVFQGSDGVIVLRRYASEARKIVDAVGSSVDRMELDDQLRFLRIRTRIAHHPRIDLKSPWSSFRTRQNEFPHYLFIDSSVLYIPRKKKNVNAKK